MSWKIVRALIIVPLALLAYLIMLALGLVLALAAAIVIGLLLAFIFASFPLLLSYFQKIKKNNLIDAIGISYIPYGFVFTSLLIFAFIYPSFSTLNLYFNGLFKEGKVVSHFEIYMPPIQSAPGYMFTYSRVFFNGDTLSASNVGKYPIGKKVNFLINKDLKEPIIIFNDKEHLLFELLIQGIGIFLFSTLAGIYLLIGASVLWTVSISIQFLSHVKLIVNNNKGLANWDQLSMLFLSYLTMIPIVFLLVKSSYMGINNQFIGSLLITFVVGAALFTNVFEGLFTFISSLLLGKYKPITLSFAIISRLVLISTTMTFIWASFRTLMFRSISFGDAILEVWGFLKERF